MRDVENEESRGKDWKGLGSDLESRINSKTSFMSSCKIIPPPVSKQFPQSFQNNSTRVVSE